MMYIQKQKKTLKPQTQNQKKTDLNLHHNALFAFFWI